ncbi:hypothetical protein ACJRO7_020061 [Eucalyptus globulus]|uniref:Disease resistance R13L4/SHOC-2-like LRR domain-containing protein n=1 Tax=Eucalyptus globulus TaxID=34317 RepID=A0ABD3KF98_EUCGL
MADTREGEDGGLFRPEGKSNEKGGGSAPQIHLGRPRLGTSSSKGGVHPDALEKREVRYVTPRKYPREKRSPRERELYPRERRRKSTSPRERELYPRERRRKSTSPRERELYPPETRERELEVAPPPRKAKLEVAPPPRAKGARVVVALPPRAKGARVAAGTRVRAKGARVAAGTRVRAKGARVAAGTRVRAKGARVVVALPPRAVPTATTAAPKAPRWPKFSFRSLFSAEAITSVPKSHREHPDALKKEEPSAFNFDDKASEEGSATESHCETGKGISVIKSPPGDSGLTQEGDLVRLRHHKEQLIESLRKVNSGTTDVPEILDDSLLCLLYLSIFPENSEISCRRVSRLWAAEGLLTDLRKAEVFLNDLLDRKYIHRVKERADGELSTFRLDDSVRQTIASFSDLLGVLKITNEGSKNSSERVRRLSVQGGIVTDLNEEKLSQLRSLFVFNVSSNKDETTTSKASLLGNSENPLFPFNFKFLKVLDLTSPPPHTAPDELILLRYLSLWDTSIKEIPAFIGRLKHLEFLDLKHSLVTELPEEVGGLKEICHILIYHHEKDPLMESYNLIGFKALCSVGGLKRLEKLCFVESDDSILKDLQNLTKLTRLGITKLRKEHGKGLCTSLKELKKLESLNLHAFDEDEILDVHYLSSPPESLKRLYLHGRLDKLPNWISPHCHLTKIVLRWSCLKGATWQNEESHMEAAAQQEKESHLEAATQQEEDLLATLGKLPELVELELRRAYHGRQLDFKNGQFPKLKILLLDELGRLRSMSLEEGTMPCLEDLTISRCQWLERIPTGIEHIISTLQALEFFDMSREFYKMVPDDYRNSLKVHLTQWRPGQWKTTPLVLDECDECFAGEH